MNTEKSAAMLISEIEAARLRVQAIASALTDIAQEQRRVLTTDTFDFTALTTLDGKGAALTREQGFLDSRIQALVSQLEQAEAREAQAQLDAMPTEVAGLHGEWDAALSEVNTGFALLVERFAKLGEIQRKHHACVSLARFFDERYAMTVRPRLDPLPEPPNYLKLGTQLITAYIAALGQGRMTEGERRLREWTNNGRKRPALRAA